MKKVTILRKWNSPQIEIRVTSESIQIDMTLDDFIRALTDEVAEPLVKQISQDIGNPTLLFTKSQLEKRIVDSVEGAESRAIFSTATEKIIDQVKKETIKVM